MKTKLPEGWKEVELGEIGLIVTGNTPPKIDEKNYGEDIVWIKPLDLDKEKYVNDSSEKISKYAKEKVRLLPKGSVLVSCIGMIGKVAIANCELCTNQQINSIIPKKEVIDSEFLYYTIKKIRSFLEKQGSSAVVPLLNKSEFSRIKIILPPLPTQQKIISILEKAEKAKEWRKEADVLTKEFLKAVFMEMFGNVKSRNKLEVDALGNHTEVITKGETPLWKGDKYVDEGILFIRSENVLSGKLDLTKKTFISSEVHQRMRRSQLRKNDVLLNIVGASIGRAAIFEQDCEANINQAIAIIRLKKTLIPAYASSFLNSPFAQSIYKDLQKGLARDNLSLTQMRDFNILVPPIGLQQKFASIVKEVESMKEQQKHSKEHLDNLFNVLMQKAFKGG